jgi:hypothetical protein
VLLIICPLVLLEMDLVSFEFAAGPLGISLTDTRTIREVFADGQGHSLGVRCGDVLVRCGETDVSATEYTEILTMIKSAPRPLQLVFARRRVADATASATATVDQIGGFFKKAISSGVSFVAALDKAISSAVDDSANVCIRRKMLCVTGAL